MKKAILKQRIVALLALVVVAMFVSCSSKKTADPDPTGALSGVSYPATAITMVKATGALGQVASVQSDRNSGTFVVKNLKADVYTLEFETSSGYATPPSRRVTVTAGQTSDAGTVVCQTQAPPQDPITGQFNDSRGGGTYQARGSYASASLVNGVLRVSIDPFNSCRSVRLTLPSFTGTGTYPISATANTATYGISCPNSVNFSATSGSVVIKQFDAVNRKVTADFNFAASAPGSPPQTISVSSGSFDLNYY